MGNVESCAEGVSTRKRKASDVFSEGVEWKGDDAQEAALCVCLNGGGPFDSRRLRMLRALLEQHFQLSVQLFCLFSQDASHATHFSTMCAGVRQLWVRAGAPECEVRPVAG